MIPKAIQPAIEFEPREISPEQRLFAAVIYQALLDATRDPSQWDRSPQEQDRDRARTWLTRDSIDLRMTCDYAGLHAESVLKVARKAAESGWQRLPRLKEPWHPARKIKTQRGARHGQDPRQADGAQNGSPARA